MTSEDYESVSLELTCLMNLKSIVAWPNLRLSCELRLTWMSSCHHQSAKASARFPPPKSLNLIRPNWKCSLIGEVTELRAQMPIKISRKIFKWSGCCFKVKVKTIKKGNVRLERWPTVHEPRTSELILQAEKAQEYRAFHKFACCLTQV